MDKRDIFGEAIGRIDPKYTEAAARKMSRKERVVTIPARRVALLAAAAVLILALIVGGVLGILRLNREDPKNPTQIADHTTAPEPSNPTDPKPSDEPSSSPSESEPSNSPKRPPVSMASALKLAPDVRIGMTSAFLPFGDRVALYSSVYIPDDYDADSLQNEAVLHEHLGELYYSGAGKWHLVDNSLNLQYLIREESDGRLSLWQFSCFQTWGGDTLQKEFPGCSFSEYEYKTLLATFYHVTSAEDIVKIEILPVSGTSYPSDPSLQTGFEPIVIESENDIQTVYDILRKMVCYGTGSMAEHARMVVSPEIQSKLSANTSLQAFYERDVRITLRDGSVIEGLKYSAVWGSFYEQGGIAYTGLTEDDVTIMNDYADIQTS